jgi:hypothetical protein
MSKVVGLLIFFLSSTLSFGSSPDCIRYTDSKPVITVDHPISEQYEAQGLSAKAIVSSPTGIPRPDSGTATFIRASDIALHGAAISICQHDLDIIEVFSSHTSAQSQNAFSDPPDQTTFFNLLFRVIISPNAP